MSGNGAGVVVVTGLGTVSPFGEGLEAFRAGLARGLACSRPVAPEASLGRGVLRTAASVTFAPEAFDASAGFARLPRGTQMSMVAAAECFRDGQVALESSDRTRIGTFFASARIALEKTEKFYQVLLEKGPRLVNPLAFQETVNNASVAHLCLSYKLTGPSLALTSGGTAGLQALAMAADWLRAGRIDLALVVAAESLPPLSLACHRSARGHAPVDAAGVSESCPFDRRRNGYVFGEGAAALLLETRAHAEARRVPAHAAVAACALAHGGGAVGHFEPQGKGLERTMRAALAAAGSEPAAVGWILADARSSRSGDLAEARAIARVFGAEDGSPPVSAIKSMIGETEAAAPAFGLLAAVTGMEDALLYPTANLEEPDAACRVKAIAGRPVRGSVSTTMINASWYGGASGTLLVRAGSRSRPEL